VVSAARRRAWYAARDSYHNAVKAALIADGWAIIHDPYRVEYGGQIVAADAEMQLIVVDMVTERIRAWRHFPATDKP